MFRELTLLVAVGLAGPLLASWRKGLIPVVIGELAAGAIIGRTGFQWIDPSQSVFPTLYALGFAMLMLTAGTHVDIRSPVIRAGAARGALALVVVFAASVPLGIAIGFGLGLRENVLLVVVVIVLLAGSSAAVAFPIMEERGLTGPTVAFLTAWIALADAVTVILMPLGLSGFSKLVGALIGDALILAAGVVILLIALRIKAGRVVKDSFRDSRAKGWALQLRVSILLLLALASVAEGIGGSLLVAGFLAGMIVIRLGPPDRLQLQISGVANGFFVPFFFVLLGAEIDLRKLVAEPPAIAFALAMAAGAIIAHVTASLVVGTSRRVATGLAASAQLGLPAAAASLGLATGAISPAYAAALVAAGCLTLVPATLGAMRLGP